MGQRPELLRASPARPKPLGELCEADLFAFRNARLREGKVIVETGGEERRKRKVLAKASTLNRDLRTLRAALKKARPDYRFPPGVFFFNEKVPRAGSGLAGGGGPMPGGGSRVEYPRSRIVRAS